MSSDTSWIRNEPETRTNLILPKLHESGWGKDGARIREEWPISIGRLLGHGNQRSSSKSADYVLEYKNMQLAVIEAKKTTLDYTAGVSQAKFYAKTLKLVYVCNQWKKNLCHGYGYWKRGRYRSFSNS